MPTMQGPESSQVCSCMLLMHLHQMHICMHNQSSIPLHKPQLPMSLHLYLVCGTGQTEKFVSEPGDCVVTILGATACTMHPLHPPMHATMQAKACSFERNDVSLSERFWSLCCATHAQCVAMLHAHLGPCHAPSNAVTRSSNALTRSDNSCKMTKLTSCITCATAVASTMPTCNASVMQCLISFHGIIHVGTSPCCNAPQ